MIDVLATEGHFASHLGPVWAALAPELRGAFHTAEGADRGGADAVLVASYGDHKRARAAGYSRIARMEHGAGQSYRGEPRAADVPNYAGGRDAGDVGLFLVPGPDPAARWRTAYPAARVEIVGSPRLDDLPRRAGEPGRVVAIAFHFNAYVGCPEADSAFRWYRDQLRTLGSRFEVIGHAHPRWAPRVAAWFRRAGLPFVDDFDEVCRQADLYACDNSSTLFEFASTGRPVVLLNCPAYRRSVAHGLRYWDAAHVGVQASPKNIRDVLEEGFGDDPAQRQNREHALSQVYGIRRDAATVAAAALTDWLEGAA